MKTTLSPDDVRTASAPLEESLERFARRFPGDRGERQPIHTVYGGAQLFKSDTTVKLGTLALRALKEYGPDPETF
ncbi:MAG TPA: phosphoenolpyruvate kinase, partial [Thermoanaerobaculia bacterium]|nr:phosphoenolpyruvate kinase [Thermoanaerobaculia bacterium]